MDNSVISITISLLVLSGLAILVSTGLRSKKIEEDLPPNLTQYKSDDELETKHLDKVLTIAVLLSSLLTVMIPLYYLGEERRQEGLKVEFDEVSIERGHHLYEEFGCGNCHGVDGSGGAASYVEKRSGVNVTWAAPAINNIFYRYEDDEVRFWLIYGRANSPMPAWGLAGGGPMNDGQLDDLISYLHHIQVSQVDTLMSIESNINSALLRLETADIQVENEIAKQNELIEDIKAASSKLPIAHRILERADTLIKQETGIDSDGDGLTDSVENQLSVLAEESSQVLGTALFTLDPNKEKTSPLRGDLSTAKSFISELESKVLNLTITTENEEKYLVNANQSLAFLQDALEARNWNVSFQDISTSTFEGNYDQAVRAVGLFNAYLSLIHISEPTRPY